MAIVPIACRFLLAILIFRVMVIGTFIAFALELIGHTAKHMDTGLRQHCFHLLELFLRGTRVSTTMSAPSTFEARMLASDKPNRGGVSKITTSIPQFAITRKKALHHFRLEQFRGIGWQRAGGHHPQIWNADRVDKRFQ